MSDKHWIQKYIDIVWLYTCITLTVFCCVASLAVLNFRFNVHREVSNVENIQRDGNKRLSKYHSMDTQRISTNNLILAEIKTMKEFNNLGTVPSLVTLPFEHKLLGMMRDMSNGDKKIYDAECMNGEVLESKMLSKNSSMALLNKIHSTDSYIAVVITDKSGVTYFADDSPNISDAALKKYIPTIKNNTVKKVSRTELFSKMSNTKKYNFNLVRNKNNVTMAVVVTEE